jgi:stage V sporulation protein D (sporulation-specific penicillin-binding protein)
MKFNVLREVFLRVCVLCFMCLLLLRIGYLQIIEHDFFKAKSTIQLKRLIKLYPHRGFIFDRHMGPLALTKSSYSVFIVPEKMDTKIIQELCSVLNLDIQEWTEKIQNSKSNFLWLKRQLSTEEYKQLKSKNLNHVGFIKTEKRVYPKADFASHILGFVGIDNQGLGGLEHKFDFFLCGTPGKIILEKDPNGYPLLSGEKLSFPPYDGNHLVTTLDPFIQHISQKYLRESISENNAEKGQVIVMDPNNGDILAMVAYPGFNPNEDETTDINRKNPCVSDVYEPGSVFKVITFAGALESGVITPQTVMQVPEELVLKNTTISEAHHRPKGESDMKTASEILEQSLNVGTSLIAMRLGEEKLFDIIKAFKIGDLTGIELPAESKGLVRSLKSWSGVDIAMISFGQGIAVTPIQMISAIAAVANDGIYVKPRILRYMTNANFETLKAIPISKTPVGISKKTSLQLKEMLKGVVEKGTGIPAQIPGYSIAGKTGTAQKPKVNGLGYDAGKYVASFVGFFPVEKPKYIILVIIDSPKKSIYGSMVAAPVFKKIAQDIIQYFHIPPDYISATSK